MNNKPALDDILSSHVKGDSIVWDGAVCLYKGIEIISMFGSDRPTAVWVRNAMPDNRDNWLKVETPDFFEQFDKAVEYAKEIVNEVIETERAMKAMRDHVFGSRSKPAAGLLG
jgi:hypothetical protein